LFFAERVVLRACKADEHMGIIKDIKSPAAGGGRAFLYGIGAKKNSIFY
jgi:hypothetical protein